MKIYLINLDRDKERLEWAIGQLAAFGLPFERMAAVNGRGLPDEEVSSAYKRFRWWCALGRPIRIGEIGCALSHFTIYRKMLADGDCFACVLEDDVILEPEFGAILQEVEMFLDVTKPQVVLLSNHTGKSLGARGVVRCKGDRHSEGYVLTAKAAKSLLDVNYPMEAPCDYWDRFVKKGAIELYHAFPSVCSPNEEDFSSNTAPKGLFVVNELSMPRWIIHKMKRVVGKTIDGCWLAVDMLSHRKDTTK